MGLLLERFSDLHEIADDDGLVVVLECVLVVVVEVFILVVEVDEK